MDHSIAQASVYNTSVTSTHIYNSDNTTHVKYTCYDTATFLALYIILGTTCTIDVASEAFEQSEKVSKAHKNIEITDAHKNLTRRPSREVRCGTSEDQAGEKKMRQMRSRIGEWLEKVVRNLKAE